MTNSHAVLQLSYRLDGEPGQPVVIFSNSLGTTSALWDEQVPPLLDHFRVLRYDQRGHGSSPAPPGPYTLSVLAADVISLLEMLSIDRVSYVGLSLGAMTGIWLAAHAPERIDSLVLASVATWLLPKERWTERAVLARSGRLGEIARDAMTRWFTDGYRSRNPAVVARFEEVFASISAEGYAGCCEAIRDMDLRGCLSSVQAPTLVLTGAEDRSTPVTEGAAVAKAIRHSRFEVVDDAAHLVNVEQPMYFNAALVRHLAGVSAGALERP